MKNYVLFSVTEFIIQNILGCVPISRYYEYNYKMFTERLTETVKSTIE